MHNISKTKSNKKKDIFIDIHLYSTLCRCLLHIFTYSIMNKSEVDVRNKEDIYGMFSPSKVMLKISYNHYWTSTEL